VIPLPSDATHCIAILNLTPDSFSDGGLWLDESALLQQAEVALVAGAKVLEIGGESTRPGAAVVSVAEELERVLPAIKALHRQFPQSELAIDTRKALVAEKALDTGVTWVNDVSGLRWQGEAYLKVLQSYRPKTILMHSRGTPRTMQQETDYPKGVVATVKQDLLSLKQRYQEVGLPLEKLILDPGFGFGKTARQSLELLQHVGSLQQSLGVPLLVGVSRKSFLAGDPATSLPPTAREAQTAVAHSWAWQQGIRWFRVHDVPCHQPLFNWLTWTTE
jgi:dihydropteroate synthase